MHGEDVADGGIDHNDDCPGTAGEVDCPYTVKVEDLLACPDWMVVSNPYPFSPFDKFSLSIP